MTLYLAGAALCGSIALIGAVDMARVLVGHMRALHQALHDRLD